MIMLPYSADDIVRVLRYELANADERGLGECFAGDVRRDDDRPRSRNRRYDRDGRPVRSALLRGLALLRGI